MCSSVRHGVSVVRDRIVIQGIQFYGHHGLHEEERKLGQRFLVDVELRLDLTEAGQRDDLAASVDYCQVSAVVVEMGTREQFRLLEGLAARIASGILERFPVQEVTIRVIKPSPPIPGVSGGVAVEVTRP
jgi:dihydroneopterin aldolase